jgi:hypothetical protein
MPGIAAMLLLLPVLAVPNMRASRRFVSGAKVTRLTGALHIPEKGQ